LAGSGICVVAIDFRQGPDFKHPTSVIDILAAARWCVTSSDPGVTPASLGLLGSSSGGHLAMYAALDPDAIDREASGAIDYVIALWPVSNPLARYQYATARLHEDPETFVRFAPDRLKAGHEAYFTDQRQMCDAAIQDILVSGRHTRLPPVFVVQPELDQNVPVMMSQTLAGAWELAGGNVTYKLYEGVAHGFAHAEGPQTGACIEDMMAYIEEHT
jgi:acetyl esterase